MMPLLLSSIVKSEPDQAKRVVFWGWAGVTQQAKALRSEERCLEMLDQIRIQREQQSEARSSADQRADQRVHQRVQCPLAKLPQGLGKMSKAELQEEMAKRDLPCQETVLKDKTRDKMILEIWQHVEGQKASATMDGPAAAECPVSRPAAQFTPEGRRCTRLLLELHQISSDLGTEEFDALIEQIARTQAALREALSPMPLISLRDL